MTDGFKKVSAGQPYRGFPAATYNAIVDVVNAYRSGQLTNLRTAFDTIRSAGIIEVQNSSGADRDRLSVLGIDDPVFDPTDDVNEFRAKPRLQAITPTTAHEPDLFCILLEPLKDGEIGLACVSGVTVASVSIEDPLHEFAAVKDATVDNLVSKPDRGARILWKPDAVTGTKDCLIRIQGPPQVGIITMYAGSCDDPRVDSSDCVWSASLQEVDVTGSTVCSPWADVMDVWAIATNACEDLTTMKLRGGERFVAVRVGRWDSGGDERPLYAIMAPHGKVRVNEDDELDYLEDQFEDHNTPAYASGDLLVAFQTDVVASDQLLRAYIDAAGYTSGNEQALTHPSGADTPTWMDVESVEVVTDLRLYSGMLQKRTSTIKVLANTDNGWSEAFPATEC